MSTDEKLATLNAFLNGTSAVLLLSAWFAIKRGRRVARHRFLMLSAVTTSALFLTSYLIRHLFFGETKFQGTGILRPIYFTILISHVLLAVAVLPMILRTLYLGLKHRFEEHRRIARITFPIWTYVSITGVVVYWFLYRL